MSSVLNKWKLSQRAYAFLLPVVLCFGSFGFLISKLTTYGLWTDEIGCLGPLKEAHGPFDALNLIWKHDTAPPAYGILAYFWTLLLDDFDFAIRLPAAISSAACVAAAYAAGRIVGSRLCAILASLLAVVCPFLLRYGLDARPYSLVVFLGFLSWPLALTLTKRGVSVAGLCGIAAFAWLCLLVHYFSFFAFAILCLGVFMARPWRAASDIRPVNDVKVAQRFRGFWYVAFVLLSGGIFVTLIAIYKKLGTMNIAREVYHTDLSPSFFLSFLGQIWRSEGFGDEFKRLICWDPLPLAVLLLTLAGVAFGKWRPRGARWIVAAQIVAAVIVIPIISWKTRNLLSVRFAAFGVPPLILCIAQALASCFHFSRGRKSPALQEPSSGEPTFWQRRFVAAFQHAPLDRILSHDVIIRWPVSGVLKPLVAVVLLVFVLLILGYPRVIFFEGWRGHYWREVATYLDQAMNRRSPVRILVSNPGTRNNLAFYAQQKPQEFEIMKSDTVTTYEEWVFVVASYGGTEQSRKLVANLAQTRQTFTLPETFPTIQVFLPKSITDSKQTKVFHLEEALVLYRLLPQPSLWGAAIHIAGLARQAGEKRLPDFIWSRMLAESRDPAERAGAHVYFNEFEMADDEFRRYTSRTPSCAQRSYLVAGHAQVLVQLYKKTGRVHYLHEADESYARAVAKIESNAHRWIEQAYRGFRETYQNELHGSTVSKEKQK